MDTFKVKARQMDGQFLKRQMENYTLLVQNLKKKFFLKNNIH